jgi:hypothetical protein
MEPPDESDHRDESDASADDASAPEELRKGRIFAEFWIMCGVCGRAAPLEVPKRRFGAPRAAAWGWKHTQTDGWVCPACKDLWISPNQS